MVPHTNDGARKVKARDKAAGTHEREKITPLPALGCGYTGARVPAGHVPAARVEWYGHARRGLNKHAHVHRRGARVVGVFLLELIGEGAHDVVHLACKATRNRQKRRFPRSRRHPAGVSRRALHRSAARGTPAASADETTPWRPRSPTVISPPHTHPPTLENK